MTSVHDHGNCELCDELERRLTQSEDALRELRAERDRETKLLRDGWSLAFREAWRAFTWIRRYDDAPDAQHLDRAEASRLAEERMSGNDG